MNKQPSTLKILARKGRDNLRRRLREGHDQTDRQAALVRQIEAERREKAEQERGLQNPPTPRPPDFVPSRVGITKTKGKSK